MEVSDMPPRRRRQEKADLLNTMQIDISKAIVPLLSGVVISIDPSVGSSSSSPGYAVYEAGKLLDSGIFQMPLGAPLHLRLRRLQDRVVELLVMWTPDVLVYEDVPIRAYGAGYSQLGHSSLLKGVGAILSSYIKAGLAEIPGHVIGLKPIHWKKLVRDTYIKGDEADAIEMGYIAITQARALYEKEGSGDFTTTKSGKVRSRGNNKSVSRGGSGGKAGADKKKAKVAKKNSRRSKKVTGRDKTGA